MARRNHRPPDETAIKFRVSVIRRRFSRIHLKSKMVSVAWLRFLQDGSGRLTVMEELQIHVEISEGKDMAIMSVNFKAEPIKMISINF